jgi:hypothetical protein
MKKIIFAVVVLVSAAANAFAGMNEFESCRCNNGIASKGDSKSEVTQECGKPVRRDYRYDSDCTEMWIYNFGPNEFMQGICFDRNERVKKVFSLGHGY